MREIKFRAWDKLGNRMINSDCVDLFIHFDGELNSMDDDCNVIGTNRTSKFKLQLMQYTGLKDKNGTEVFEGDIVNMIFPGTKGPRVIEFLNGAFGVKTHKQSTELWWEEVWHKDIEIIGNIYENIDLLK